MRLGFDVSDLCPERGGVFTYGSQLAQHLTRLADPPTFTLIDGTLRTGLQQPLVLRCDSLQQTVRSTRVRGLVRSVRGPWRTRYIDRIASAADECILLPFWRRVEATAAGSRVARWRLPVRATGMLDVCHWSDSAFLPLPGIAHVLTVHDTIVLLHPEWHRRRDVAYHIRKLRMIARHATRIIADSENTRQDVINLLGVSSERIDVVPLAAGPEFRPPTDRAAYLRVLARYGLREHNYILGLGTIEPRKNVVRLAEGFKAALEWAPDRATRLVLAGGKGWRTDPIERGLHALGLGERLLMPGRVPQEDLPALLHGARAVAYVSLYEGFGLPPLEAMACGAPIVASNTSSLPEVVGDAGLLVDPYSVAEIAAALHAMLSDDGLRAELAARGLRQAARFSWARTAELTMQTYRRALDAPRGGEHSGGACVSVKREL